MALLAHAQAAPVVGIGALTGLLLVLALAFVATWATIKLYDLTMGALLRGVSDLVGALPFVGGFGERKIEALDQFILRQLGHALNGLETATAATWDALGFLVRETGKAMEALASATHDAIRNIHVADIPEQVSTATLPLKSGLARTKRDVHERARAEAKARSRGIDEVTRDLTRERLAREKGIDYIGARINARVMPRIRSLDRELAALRGYTRRVLSRRISKVEAALAAGVVGAIALATLTRYFPWFRCTNVRRFNRFLCRLPVGLLDDLLGLTIAALVLADVCRIGRLGTAAARVAAPLLLEIVGVVDAATNCTSFPKPPALSLNTTPLPPTTGALAL